MHFIKLINNPTLMGLIGVIVGAIIGGIITLKSNDKNNKYQNDREWRDKIAMTTREFIILLRKLNAENCYKNDMGSKQKWSMTVLELSEIVKAEAELYYDKEERTLMYEILKMQNLKTDEERRNYNDIIDVKMEQFLGIIRRKLR